MRSRKSRKHNMAVFDQLYELDYRGNRLECAYCGDVRSELDHCPPIAVVGLVGTKKLRERGVKFRKYPCCSACNNTLGGKPLTSYGERLLYLYNNLLKKAEKLPHWSDDEIEELGGDLKRQVKARQLHTRREVTTRLRGMERSLAACTFDDDFF